MEEKKEKDREKIIEERIEARKAKAIHITAHDSISKGDSYVVLLMHSVDKLQKSVEKASRSSDKLTKTTNNLTAKIKTLTWIIVVISLIGLLIAGYEVFLK